MDHLALLLWHALLVSVFFAFLWRSTAVGRRNLFLKTFLIMVVGGTMLGWLMYPFP
ncbi:MAG: hypothetical protein IFK91_06820 [Acidobacteria bacterium]|jgi:hypothetical protein|nr:hypothetical protein [Candidatus Sulfomarinibacter sp. MAG AM1]